MFLTAIFLIEFVLRMGVCFHKGQSKLQFVVSRQAICDLLAISPIFLEIIFSGLVKVEVLRIMRSVRLTRIARVFKLGPYATGLRMMITAIRNSASILTILGFFLIMGSILCSAAMYHLESLQCPVGMVRFQEENNVDLLTPYNHRCSGGVFYHKSVSSGAATNETSTFRHQWDGWAYMGDVLSADDILTMNGFYGQLLCCDEYGSSSTYQSIIMAMWWAVATLTSVGYGDMYPKTTTGIIVGMFTAIFGVLSIAVPLAIVARKLAEVYEKHNMTVGGQKQKADKEKEEMRKEMRMQQEIAMAESERDGASASIPGGSASTWNSSTGFGDANARPSQKYSKGHKAMNFVENDLFRVYNRKFLSNERFRNDNFGDMEPYKLIGRMQFEDHRLNTVVYLIMT